MACHAVQMWSLSGLVAAFLDLTIAYLLLCGSAVAYLASKFLGFFGLSLPCPCDGMFMNVHSRSLCFNKLLVDFPLQKLSDVQLSVRQKFPFSNSVSPKKYDSSGVGDACGYGIPELEVEASCSSSISDAKGSGDMVRRESNSRSGKIDMKGKGVLSNRSKSRLRQQKGVGGHGQNSSIFSYDPPALEEVINEQPYHHFSSNKRGCSFSGDGLLSVDNAGKHNLEYDKASKKPRARLRTLSIEKINMSPYGDMHMKKSTLSCDDLQDNQQGILDCDGDVNSKIKLLEQALENERAARAALCIDLEEERSAAASAADEAMAMILRLQEEKASIEMEARQYKRMIEEKSAYDDEEMDILEEILVRREKEKLFLEKELETYRQMVSRGNDRLSGDFSDNNYDGQILCPPLNDPDDDPVSFLPQLAASTDKNVTMENKCADDDSESKLNYNPTLGIESPFQHHDEHSNFSSGKVDHWKEIIPMDKDMQSITKAPLECEKSIPCNNKDLEQVQEMNQGHKLTEKVITTCYGTEKGDPTLDPSLKQQATDEPLGYRSSFGPILDKDPHVYDVHIIGDGIDLCNEATADKGEQFQFSGSLNLRESETDFVVQSGTARERINDINDTPGFCCLETEAVVRKSSPEITSCLPPTGRRGSSLGLRRRSTSFVDTEMLKIGTEIMQLRDRLKLVQEGRGKLGISLEYRESKNSQLRILEDIALQIQEIRRLSEPEKASRQASLPPPNSKGLSKRRRSKSVSSLGFQLSSEG